MNKNKNPLVSVIIPFYSNKEWLQEAVMSVVNQSYKNLEIIIINDGSPENIKDIEVLDDQRIRIIHKKNGGPSSARNKGIKKANGIYIAFLDSDDIWVENKIYEQVSFMLKTEYKWSQHSYLMFWENKNKKPKVINTSNTQGNVNRDLYISFKVQTSTIMVERKILVNNNILFPLDKRYGQDIYFFREIAKTYPLGYLEGTYSYFRIRGKNAGFKASVQLNFRAESYDIIINDEQLTKDLPRGVVYAHKLSNKLDQFYKKILLKSSNNNTMDELLAGIFYSIPYFIIKLY